MADIPDKPEDDDYFYLRWLRARKFKVRKAEEMLRKVRRLFCVCSVMSRADHGQCALDVSRLSPLVSSPDHEEKWSGEPS